MLKKILVLVILLISAGSVIIMYHFLQTEKKPEMEINPFLSTSPKDPAQETARDITRGYEEALSSLREEKELKLKSIMLETAEGWQDKVQYAFITEKEMIVAMYDRDDKKVEISMRAALPENANLVAPDQSEDQEAKEKTSEVNEDNSDPNQAAKKVTVSGKSDGSALALLASPAYPEISSEMAKNSFKKTFLILKNHEDYKTNYKKYSDSFKNYRARLMYSPQYGWEWKFEFYPDLAANPENIESAKTISFAVSTENDKVTLTGKVNMD